MTNTKSYEISSYMHDDVIEIDIAGTATEDCVEDLKSEINTLIKLTNPRKLLTDLRALKIPRFLSEAFSGIRNYPPLFHIKTAVVILAENAESQMFYETEANHAGLKMRWFTDIEAARNWLKN